MFQAMDTEKNFVIAPETAYASSCIVKDTGVKADDYGRKIIKAGTALYRATDANGAAIMTISSESGEACGVARHNIDVTKGSANAAILVSGCVDLLKLDSSALESLTSETMKKLKIVFQYGRKDNGILRVAGEQELLAAIKLGGSIKLDESVKVTKRLEISNDTILDLNGKTISAQSGNTTVFWVKDESTLTIVGNGVIESKGDEAVYIFAVGNGSSEASYKSATLVIENGTFTTEAASVIQVEWGKAIVKGGTFSLEKSAIDKGWSKYTINYIDGRGDKTKCEVSGGRFYKFNPGTDSDENLLAKGYKAVPEGDYFNVVPE